MGYAKWALEVGQLSLRENPQPSKFKGCCCVARVTWDRSQRKGGIFTLLCSLDPLDCIPLQLYQPLGLRVALTGLEVWSNRDKITVSRKAEETLENFLRWRETDLLKRKQHDNVQLIT